MIPTRRLTTCVLAAALLGSLTACGQDNPFGKILTGSGSTTPSATPSDTTTATTTDAATDAATSTDTTAPGESSTSAATGDASPSESVSGPASGTPSSSMSSSPSATSGTTSPETPGTATTGAATTGGAGQGSVVQIDGRTIQGVPVGLAFPDGTKIEGNSGFANGGGTIVLSAPAEAQLFSYYRSALPGAGYRIVSDTAGVLAFTGHGYRGTLVGTGTGGVLTWSPMAR